MYHYVDDKEFLKRAQNSCSNFMTRIESLLREKYDINSQFFLIGSGARNMVTQNAEESIDFDYNINVLSFDCSEKELKDKVIAACNTVMREDGLDDVDDSTSSITTKAIHFRDDPAIEFKMDIAIVSKEKEKWYRLIHDKTTRPNQYYWNEAPNSKSYADKATAIKKVPGAWELVRDQYLEVKNRYLRKNDYNHPSFICYIEAVNNVYNDLRQKKII